MTIYHGSRSALACLLTFAVALAVLIACKPDAKRDEDRAYALLEEAMNHNAAGEKQQALALIDSALALNPEDTTRSWLNSERMTAYTDQGCLSEAIAVGRACIPFADSIGDHDGMMAMCGAMGICYRRLGSVDSSLVYYQKGLQTAVESGNAEYEAYLCNCIAVLYSEQQHYPEAMEYSGKAECCALATGDTVEWLSARANKGVTLMRQGKFRESVDVLLPVWGLVQGVGYNVLTLKFLSPLLKSYLMLDRTDSVAHYLACADEVCQGMPSASNGVLGIMEIKNDLLGRLGRYAEQKMLLDSMQHLSSLNQVMPMDKLLAEQAECLQHLGRLADAYATMREAYHQSDSLKQSDIDRQLTEFNVKYNTLEREVQLERVNNERNMLYNRMLWLTIALIVLAVIFLLVLYRRTLDRQRAELAEKTSYIQGVETERTRLAKELHDGVCNDILAVSLVMQTDYEEAERMLRNVAHDVRRLSHELVSPRFVNASLAELVKAYCQSVSTPDGSVVMPFVSESFARQTLPADASVEVYRIVQECVSNALKYGYSKAVTVALDVCDGQAIVCVGNDLSPSHPIVTDKGGVGRDTLRMRAEALQAELHTEVTKDKYQVSVAFPVVNGQASEVTKQSK